MMMKKILSSLVLVIILAGSVFAASTKYNYTIDPVNTGALKIEINNSTITIKVDRIDANGESVDIWMMNTLSASEEDFLSDLVTAHTGAAIEEKDPEVIVKEQELAVTKDRLKWKGYKFTAYANQITTYSFVMPYKAHLQGGVFYAYESTTGDMLELELLPDTPYAYKYVETLYLTKEAIYLIKEDFSKSAELAVGTPINIYYTNTDSTDKEITFVIIMQLPLTE